MRKVSSKKRARKLAVMAHGHGGFRVLARRESSDTTLEAYRRGLADGVLLGTWLVQQSRPEPRMKPARRVAKRRPSPP
jgi:hypothetical protein